MFFTSQRVCTVEHYLESLPYFKCQGDVRSAFPKSQVPHKSTVFHLIANFREKAIVSDPKHSGRPTVLNGVSVGNSRKILVQWPREF
jgi:hypothetical protein